MGDDKNEICCGDIILNTESPCELNHTATATAFVRGILYDWAQFPMGNTA